jgi:hypothetical protein
VESFLIMTDGAEHLAFSNREPNWAKLEELTGHFRALIERGESWARSRYLLREKLITEKVVEGDDFSIVIGLWSGERNFQLEKGEREEQLEKDTPTFQAFPPLESLKSLPEEIIQGIGERIEEEREAHLREVEKLLGRWRERLLEEIGEEMKGILGEKLELLVEKGEKSQKTREMKQELGEVKREVEKLRGEVENLQVQIERLSRELSRLAQKLETTFPVSNTHLSLVGKVKKIIFKITEKG